MHRRTFALFAFTKEEEDHIEEKLDRSCVAAIFVSLTCGAIILTSSLHGTILCYLGRPRPAF